MINSIANIKLPLSLSDVGFKLWAYSVSHKVCIFRGLLPDSNCVNVDIVFVEVARINSVTNAIENFNMKEEKSDEKLLITISSGKEVVAEVVASSYSIELNDLPTMALPYEQEIPYEKVQLEESSIVW